MTTKRCVMCGKEMKGEDQFTETCYNCQDKSMENFPLIASTLNDILLDLEKNENLQENKKQVRAVAVYESIKFFGDVPEFEIIGADEYLDDTKVLVEALNDILEELEEVKVSEESAWKIYSLVHAIKEYGGNPVVEFYKSKHGSEINL